MNAEPSPRAEIAAVCPAKEARRRAMTPMTQAEYQEHRSRITEVYDEASGRYRLVRGDGEILERIVSRQQHEQINRSATQSDGTSFARQVRRRAHPS